MTRRLLFCFAILSVAAPNVHSQGTIDIPFATTPSVDGVVSPGEWIDANSKPIVLGSGDKVSVLFKHNGQSLFFAYQGNLESAIRFPEILLDVLNNKSTEWDENDWWFHASATDCEFQGDHSTYTNCEVEKTGWRAAPNMTQGGDATDTIEIEIPFALIGIDAAKLPATIGLSLEVTNTFSAWEHWPSTAAIDDPSTWGNAVIKAGSMQATPTASASTPRWHWLDQDRLQVHGEQILAIEIRDVVSRKLLRQEVDRSRARHDINIGDLTSGPYFMLIQTIERSYVHKLLVN